MEHQDLRICNFVNYVLLDGSQLTGCSREDHLKEKHKTQTIYQLFKIGARTYSRMYLGSCMNLFNPASKTLCATYKKGRELSNPDEFIAAKLILIVAH